MNTTKRVSAIVLLITAALLSLAACNTTAGVGRDMKSTGNAIEDAKN